MSMRWEMAESREDGGFLDTGAAAESEAGEMELTGVLGNSEKREGQCLLAFFKTG